MPCITSNAGEFECANQMAKEKHPLEIEILVLARTKAIIDVENARLAKKKLLIETTTAKYIMSNEHAHKKYELNDHSGNGETEYHLQRSGDETSQCLIQAAVHQLLNFLGKYLRT